MTPFMLIVWPQTDKPAITDGTSINDDQGSSIERFLKAATFLCNFLILYFFRTRFFKHVLLYLTKKKLISDLDGKSDVVTPIRLLISSLDDLDNITSLITGGSIRMVSYLVDCVVSFREFFVYQHILSLISQKRIQHLLLQQGKRFKLDGDETPSLRIRLHSRQRRFLSDDSGLFKMGGETVNANCIISFLHVNSKIIAEMVSLLNFF